MAIFSDYTVRKLMKKIILFFIPVFVSIAASSQVEFGLFAGPQLTYSHYTIRDEAQKNKIKYGFQAGATLKVPFENKIFFSPMMFYSMKGYKVTLNQFSYPPDSNAIDNDTRLHTFEIVPMLQYDFGTTSNHFFIRGGPSLDIQLFGHEKFNRTTGAPVSRNMKFGFADYGYFAINFLLHVGFETENGLMIFAQYTHGVGGINNADNGPKILHRAAGISMGYYFNRKKQ